jgi:hypothetical protein
MQIRFLRPELEKLHTRVHALSALRGAGVSADALAWEVGYVQSNDTGAKQGLYPGLLAYVAEHTPPPASVLYVGGAGARGIIPLALAGYDVTILMPAAAGLHLVREEATTAGVAEKLSYVCGYPADASALGENAFDAVVALQSIRVEKDLRSVLAALLRVGRKALCFDVVSRYGFLVGRMPGGYEWTAGFTPATMLHVLAEHETPGGRPARHEQYPLYTFDEISDLARGAGLKIDAVVPVDAKEVFQWESDSNEAAGAELMSRIQRDEVLRELARSFLVLGRKPAG